jgi:hypothetical protein
MRFDVELLTLALIEPTSANEAVSASSPFFIGVLLFEFAIPNWVSPTNLAAPSLTPELRGFRS